MIPNARVRLPGPRHSSSSEKSPSAAWNPPHGGGASRDPLAGLERADEHRGRRTLGFGDGVDQIVNAVIQVDVRDSGLAVERSVSGGRAWCGVTRWIAFANIRFDLDDRCPRPARRASRERATLPIRSRATSSVGRS